MTGRYIFVPPNSILPMMEDLRVVADIDIASLQQIGELLAQQTGFLTDERLAEIIAECLDDETQGNAVFNAVHNLGTGEAGPALAMLRAWRESGDQQRQRFPDDAFSALEQKLPILVRDYPALNRSKKADRLRNALGNEYEGVAFICDARPVYNESRDQIEGLIPLTTMKLVYEGQNSETNEIEIVLTDEQLMDFVTKAGKAKQKLAVLRESIEGWIPGGCVASGEGPNAGDT